MTPTVSAAESPKRGEKLFPGYPRYPNDASQSPFRQRPRTMNWYDHSVR